MESQARKFWGSLDNQCHGYTTPQTKPLSGDEVIKIRQTTKAKSTENWADTLAFARAIEERRD